jgi:hypothetical protein
MDCASMTLNMSWGTFLSAVSLFLAGSSYAARGLIICGCWNYAARGLIICACCWVMTAGWSFSVHGSQVDIGARWLVQIGWFQIGWFKIGCFWSRLIWSARALTCSNWHALLFQSHLSSDYWFAPQSVAFWPLSFFLPQPLINETVQSTLQYFDWVIELTFFAWLTALFSVDSSSLQDPLRFESFLVYFIKV